MQIWRQARPTDLDREARWRVALVGLVVAVVGFAAVGLAGRAPRQAIFDAYQRLLPAPAPSPDIIIVAIDEESLTAVGEWPWSRYILARLTEVMTRDGARAIGVNIVFPKPDHLTPDAVIGLYPELSGAARRELSALPSMDAVFSTVLGRSPVVLGRVGLPDGAPSGRRGALLPAATVFQGPAPSAIPTYPTALTNLDIFDGAAAGLGLLNGKLDRDGVVRSVPLVARLPGGLNPAMALEVVRLVAGAERIDLKGSAAGLSAVKIGRRQVAVDPSGALTLRFRGAAGHGSPYRVYSAADVLRDQFPASALRGKVVLLEVMAPGLANLVATPTEPATYAALVQAQAVDTLLHGGELVAPAWAGPASWLLGLAFTLVTWWAMPRGAYRTAMASLALCLPVGFGVSIALFQAGVLFDPVPTFAPTLAGSAAMVAMMFLEGRTAQAALRRSLEAQRLVSARLDGEMAAASNIQTGMLIGRSRLAQIHRAVEVDAVLQPARTVGGDFYDVFMVDDERLCLLIGDVAGKGIPAAIFMAQSKAYARSALSQCESLVDAVARMNNELARDNPNSIFVTALVGLLHVTDGRLELCRAGHELPILARRGQEAQPAPVAGGPPLCVMDDMVFASTTLQLEAGDIFLAFTDGVTEAATPDEQLFGRERILTTVTAAAEATQDLAAMVDRIVADVRAFEAGGEATDDLAILALRMRA